MILHLSLLTYSSKCSLTDLTGTYVKVKRICDITETVITNILIKSYDCVVWVLCNMLRQIVIPVYSALYMLVGLRLLYIPTFILKFTVKVNKRLTLLIILLLYT